ncbi:hypothetical protein Tco_0381322 [Tanacetum coccineum]
MSRTLDIEEAYTDHSSISYTYWRAMMLCGLRLILLIGEYQGSSGLLLQPELSRGEVGKAMLRKRVVDSLEFWCVALNMLSLLGVKAKSLVVGLAIVEVGLRLSVVLYLLGMQGYNISDPKCLQLFVLSCDNARVVNLGTIVSQGSGITGDKVVRAVFVDLELAIRLLYLFCLPINVLGHLRSLLCQYCAIELGSEGFAYPLDPWNHFAPVARVSSSDYCVTAQAAHKSLFTSIRCRRENVISKMVHDGGQRSAKSCVRDETIKFPDAPKAST